MSIDLHDFSCYNKGAMKDSPISTPPVVSPTSNTKERRQHGKTATKRKGEKTNVCK